MHGHVLVLNRNFQPLRVTSMQRAFVLLYIGRAQALGPGFAQFDFPGWIQLPLIPDHPMVRTAQKSILAPQVIVLPHYDRLPKSQVRLSRSNVYIRDGYQCQYCGIKPERSQLNLDHVLPRSRGGKTSWDNVVCCCIACNLRKAARTPAEAGMRLIRTPTQPRFSPPVRALDNPPEAWRPFLEPTLLPAQSTSPAQ